MRERERGSWDGERKEGEKVKVRGERYREEKNTRKNKKEPRERERGGEMVGKKE